MKYRFKYPLYSSYVLFSLLTTFLPNFPHNSILICYIPTPFPAFPPWFPAFCTFPLGFSHSHPDSPHPHLHFHLYSPHFPHSHPDSRITNPFPHVAFFSNPHFPHPPLIPFPDFSFTLLQIATFFYWHNMIYWFKKIEFIKWIVSVSLFWKIYVH